MSATKIGIAGCGGRMGRMLIAGIATTAGAVLTAGIDTVPDLVGRDLGPLAGLAPTGILVGTDAAALLAASDVVIDFTRPAATANLAGLAAESGTALVIGTTGLDAAQSAAVTEAASRTPILTAANFSLGVNLLLGLVEQAAARLGIDWDIEIVEMHHRMKLDAPSGTALELGRAAASGRGQALEALRAGDRQGRNEPRAGGTIGFASLRGGEVVGDHTVMFAGAGEILELTHKAADRRIFALGAIRAALWLSGKSPGLYGMKDVLAL